jgi:hypothetical protein
MNTQDSDLDGLILIAVTSVSSIQDYRPISTKVNVAQVENADR